ncbi:HlyD family type I secretion periplasmic adaptor subunit [Thioclava sp. GXIMD4216]|uniref:Membrane fusion protein (MFP) family protein n=1 Tax=Thioclava litoralis TaxID=3076557 RepID=A0ABZ1E0S6_9RHOB|nr:HlyD family type I secretion periplasmic adaptor subunit [Thioclava sp. FTW29]
MRYEPQTPLRVADLSRRLAQTPPRPVTPAKKPVPSGQIAPKDSATKRLLLLGYAALFILVVIFGSWASLTTIAGAVIVSGRLEFDTNRQVVQHPQGGRVEEIYVHDGDKVAAGDILIRLDGGDMQSDLTILEDQLFDLRARRARLQAERIGAEQVALPPVLAAKAANRADLRKILTGQSTLFDARRETLAQMLSQLDRKALQAANRLTGIDAQINAIGQQQMLLSRELQSQKGLFERGLTQRTRILSLERELASLLGQRGQLIAQRAETEEEITSTEIQKLQATSERRVEAEDQLRDIDQKELTLMEQTRDLRNKIALLDIRAPIDGIVHEMAITTRLAVLRPADPVLYLIPQDRPMLIEIRVPPMNIDEIRQDQVASLRLPSLPSRETPELSGRVLRISPDASVDPATSTTYYRAEVMPDAAAEAEMSKMPLLPGMPVEAYLRTTDRTPLSYILAPFMSYLEHAFRES